MDRTSFLLENAEDFEAVERMSDRDLLKIARKEAKKRKMPLAGFLHLLARQPHSSVKRKALEALIKMQHGRDEDEDSVARKRITALEREIRLLQQPSSVDTRESDIATCCDGELTASPDGIVTVRGKLQSIPRHVGKILYVLASHGGAATPEQLCAALGHKTTDKKGVLRAYVARAKHNIRRCLPGWDIGRHRSGSRILEKVNINRS